MVVLNSHEAMRQALVKQAEDFADRQSSGSAIATKIIDGNTGCHTLRIVQNIILFFRITINVYYSV